MHSNRSHLKTDTNIKLHLRSGVIILAAFVLLGAAGVSHADAQVADVTIKVNGKVIKLDKAKPGKKNIIKLGNKNVQVKGFVVNGAKYRRKRGNQKGLSEEQKKQLADVTERMVIGKASDKELTKIVELLRNTPNVGYGSRPKYPEANSRKLTENQRKRFHMLINQYLYPTRFGPIIDPSEENFAIIERAVGEYQADKKSKPEAVARLKKIGIDGLVGLYQLRDCEQDKAQKKILSDAIQFVYEQHLTTVKSLIKKLGDSSYRVRENADQEIFKLGELALDYVRQQFDNPDAEIAHRCVLLHSRMVQSRTGYAVKFFAKYKDVAGTYIVRRSEIVNYIRQDLNAKVNYYMYKTDKNGKFLMEEKDKEILRNRRRRVTKIHQKLYSLSQLLQVELYGEEAVRKRNFRGYKMEGIIIR